MTPRKLVRLDGWSASPSKNFRQKITITSPDGCEFTCFRHGESIAIARGAGALLVPASLIPELRAALHDLEREL